MSLTLGLTGMDPATETALKAAFIDASARAGGVWTLVPETEATHVMVDMDSMYGPMSWLRLHAGGKHVIGLTTAPRTQTDFRLGRPFDSEGFADLLRSIAVDSGVEVAAQPESRHSITAESHKPIARDDTHARDDARTQSDTAAQAAPVALSPAPPSGLTPAPAPADVLHAADAPPPGSETAVPATVPAPVPAPAALPPAAQLPATPPPPRVLGLSEWLGADGLSQRVRYRRQTGPTLLIDPVTRHYHGPSTLKPISPYFHDTIAEQDFEPVDEVSWARESAAAGAAQPLQRLEWLGALVGGRRDLAGEDDSRFRLNKWPQTEREYPKHFRIATAMMKGPATLAEIAEASGMPADEVSEFVNASLATGFAERVAEETGEVPEAAPRSGGLLGRLRGR